MSELQNSLTSPADKDPTAPTSFDQNTVLSVDDVKNALDELYSTTFTKKFPVIEKFYADPPLVNQIFSLVSFVPSKGATPDRDGVYGMLKVRGTFATSDEANLRAEYLIKNVDSYHSIYQTYVGRPFPLTKNKKYITETNEVDIKKKVVESTSEEIRKTRDEESKIVKELETRQQELMNDVDEKKDEDPYEVYTETMVKKAHLIWTYHNTQKKMEDMKKSIIAARSSIEAMNKENPDYSKQYMKKYLDARAKSGLPNNDETFVKYMAEDIDLGF